MKVIVSVASWFCVLVFAGLLALGISGLAPITIAGAILGILVATPPLRALPVARKLALTSPLRVLFSTLVLLFFTFLGTALRFDDKSVAERSTQIASNYAKSDAKQQLVVEEAAKRKTELKTVVADISVPIRSGDELREEFVRRMRGKYGPDQSAPISVLMAMTYLD